MSKIVIVGLFLINFITKSLACDCDKMLTVKEEFQLSNAVFTGRVVSIKPIFVHGQKRIPSGEIVEIRVIEAFKGVSERIVRLKITYSSCSYWFEAGKDYMIYASKGENNNLTTSVCYRTKELKDATEDLVGIKSNGT